MTGNSLSIGVDIGGTKTLIIVGDALGKVVLKERVPSTENVAELIRRIQAVLAKLNLPAGSYLGMGIGVPGRVDSRTGLVIDVPSLKWQRLNLQALFTEAFRLPIFINNGAPAPDGITCSNFV